MFVLFVVSLLYYEQVQYNPTAHITSVFWLVFPYFRVSFWGLKIFGMLIFD